MRLRYAIPTIQEQKQVRSHNPDDNKKKRKGNTRPREEIPTARGFRIADKQRKQKINVSRMLM